MRRSPLTILVWGIAGFMAGVGLMGALCVCLDTLGKCLQFLGLKP